MNKLPTPAFFQFHPQVPSLAGAPSVATAVQVMVRGMMLTLEMSNKRHPQVSGVQGQSP